MAADPVIDPTKSRLPFVNGGYQYPAGSPLPEGYMEDNAGGLTQRLPGVNPAPRKVSQAPFVEGGYVMPAGSAIPEGFKESGGGTLTKDLNYGFQPQQTVNALRASRDVPDMIGNAIESRRQQLVDAIKTQSDPDANALKPSVKRRQEILHEFSTLNTAAHEHAVERAHQTAQTFKQQRDTESANDYVGFIHDLNGITSPIGSAEHATEASRVFEDHPLALQTTAGREAGVLHARVHDTAAGLGAKFYPDQASAFAENPGATLEQDPRGRGFRVTRTRGIVQPETMVTNEATHSAAKLGFTPDEFLNADVAAGSSASGKWVGDVNGKQIRVQVGDKTSVMDVAKFNNIKRGLQTKNAPQVNVAPATPVLKYDKATGTLIKQ